MNIIFLKRKCNAILIPSGMNVVLEKDTEVEIVKNFGTSFTIKAYGNLLRINAENADAIGQKIFDPLKDIKKNISLKEKIIYILKSIYDPEIPVNIYDLGLIYKININEKNNTSLVNIDMTLTSPACGMGEIIANDVKNKIEKIQEIKKTTVNIVFIPAWNKKMMSEEAQLILGIL